MKKLKKTIEYREADAEQDLIEIPELTPEEAINLRPAREVVPWLYRPIKKRISIFIDADILEHFKSLGKGYQTKINQVLRREMLKEAAPMYKKMKK
ncbi:MAG: BrnA antitoxin family protein [Spirochaetales bacterium]|nr:BrnA antitoxin family protein [Spirochaetales bacterium]